MRTLLLIVVLLVTGCRGRLNNSLSQSISGVVYDVLGNPIPGAVIETKGNFSSISNEKGEFAFQSSDAAYVKITHRDFQTLQLSISRTPVLAYLKRVQQPSDFENFPSFDRDANYSRTLLLLSSVPSIESSTNFFYLSDEFLPYLREALGVPAVRNSAMKALAIASDSNSASEMIRQAEQGGLLDRSHNYVWVLRSLVQPESEESWRLLSNAVFFQIDGFATATKSLALNGSERAVRILDEAHKSLKQRLIPTQQRLLESALKFAVKPKPNATDEIIRGAIEFVSETRLVSYREIFRIENRSGAKMFIKCGADGPHSPTYLITLGNNDGRWRILGVFLLSAS